MRLSFRPQTWNPEWVPPLAGPDTRRFARFLLVGGLNTAFGYAVYAGGLLIGLPKELALLLATVLGLLFNFHSYGGLVFADRRLRRLPRFLVGYGIAYGVNVLGLNVLVHWRLHPLVAQLVLLLPIAILLYHLLKRFAFAAYDK